MNPLKKLHKYGQAFWLDYMRRALITSGELRRMVKEDGLRGVTSNPTIFQKAIAGSSDYDAAINKIVNADPHLNVKTFFTRLATTDIQMAADVLRPLYKNTQGEDGFVSFELPPDLARDTKGSITEARRLWKSMDRPNVMIKVPATKEGIPVIETLIAEGINVNVTLIFSLSHYDAIAEAFLKGLEQCATPNKVASVASFFVSRIDSAVDKRLEKIGTPEAVNLRGKIAIANAKIVYKRFKEMFRGERWAQQMKRGARVQRILWASTSTKNPAYSDVRYVEELIGEQTVNTMPPLTITAFRDHGQLKATLKEGWNKAEATLTRLAKLGVDLNTITERLQKDGVDAFTDAYNHLLETLGEKRKQILQGQVALRVMNLGKYQAAVDKRLTQWKQSNFTRRIWEKDPTLWFAKPVSEITNRLGWLGLPESMHDQLDTLRSFAARIRSEGVRDVVLLGMGGSSLAPEVFQTVFGNEPPYPKLTLLDSTHPSAIKAVETQIDLKRTLFVVSSKSGTTVETLSLFKYFWSRVGQMDRHQGRHFVAITDPETPLARLAKKRKFRQVFQAPPDVGGRYSALTVFGLLPAALIGMDLHRLLDRAWIMAENCAFCVGANETSGLRLGAALGELAKKGRNKVTLFTSASIKAFPNWIEQLIAESLGKDGKGIIPIVSEPRISPESYQNDRTFIHIAFNEDREMRGFLERLEAKGHPTIYIQMTDKYNLSQEIFCWEMGVAAAGSVLGIHPFNQPDVQRAKDLAKEMMKKAEKGNLADEKVETSSTTNSAALARALDGWLSQVRKTDYIGIQAYLAPSTKMTDALQRLRLQILKRIGVATTVGYGPRVLHSTGQLHKGGPNTGLFLQLIDEPTEDLEVPETQYTFGTLIHAQALGDYQALKQRGRRVLRVNLEHDVDRSLEVLSSLIGNWAK